MTKGLHLFLELIDDPDFGVRSAAAGALGRLREPAALGALYRRALNDENCVVREQAVRSIGQIGGVEARRLLGHLADHADHASVRYCGRHLLRGKEPR